MMEKFVVAGGVIINSNDETILVYMPGTATWGFPKGHVEAGENTYGAALREIKEETSLEDLVFVAELPIYERKTKQDPNRTKECHFYLFRTEVREISNTDPHVSKIAWVHIDEVAEKISYREDIKFFNKIRPALKGD